MKSLWRRFCAEVRGEAFGFVKEFYPGRYRCPYKTIQHVHEYLLEEIMTPAAKDRGWLFMWQQDALDITERARRRVMPGKAIPW